MYMSYSEYILCLMTVIVCTISLLWISSKLLNDKYISIRIAFGIVLVMIYLIPITSFILFYIGTIIYMIYKKIIVNFIKIW